MTDLKMYQYENELYNQGLKYIAGVDEAGRGPLAGPVVAAAVILKKDAKLKYVNDSKQLTEKQRDLALIEIKENALAIGIGISSVDEIDRINIYRAAREAMLSAIYQLKIRPDFLLIDAMPMEIDIPFKSMIKGDTLSVSIAAASIVAKTTRDAYMIEMDKVFPQYNFKQHKGYGTKEHLEAIKTYGITPIHRKTFKPIKDMLKEII
ncbi:ribonuclease HII [Peloplasma aerotolerans]|uniref:Ribonuclease HII n=1 Tax=Peloplasma aerotolerans TaxID=3044389 RepID=A0AAW6U3P4_9MOLU|nr:ribonuclease HII [Mariniplasma sp. M4Ah]MDI6452588.1 ribonuclease HII [Mariniplasma sp. M4Ah]MDR4969328.1 ribonuclease HII [Acholeplasmataceae bacterium]